MRSSISHHVLRLTLTLLLLVTAGCQGFLDGLRGGADADLPDEDLYVKGELLAMPEPDALWERAKQAVVGENYTLDDDLTVYSRREIVSRWAMVLHWRRYEGYRTRAVVRLIPYEDGHWQVWTAVQRQVNSDMDDPMNPVNAKWEDAEPNGSAAEILLWKIESGFRSDYGE